MLDEKDMMDIVDELRALAATHEGMLCAPSFEMSGFATGFCDAMDMAEAVLLSQHHVHDEEQWKILKNRLLKIGISPAEDGDEDTLTDTSFADGRRDGREVGAQTALSMVRLRANARLEENNE